MKYKTTFLTALLAIIIYLSFSLLAAPLPQDDTPNRDQTEQEKQTGETGSDTVPPLKSETEEGSYLDPQADDPYQEGMDSFSRSVFEKAMPELSNKEKVIWAFRTANTHTFL